MPDNSLDFFDDLFSDLDHNKAPQEKATEIPPSQEKPAEPEALSTVAPATSADATVSENPAPVPQSTHFVSDSPLSVSDSPLSVPELTGSGAGNPPAGAQPPCQEEPFSDYAAQAYLAYAMSVVTGRAIPSVADGQKPVQRRILFAMREMGLHRSPKHVKSARVVGEVIGKWHPHGDTSVYDAMVRMAQDFSLRYPVVDGQGNFGSRDGDGAAAMRYTESRLLPISELLLSEIDEGTVDFRANYDGTLEEPTLLPARLPFLLLNGASGIAVGMATEIPSHNLREVAQACAALVENPSLDDNALLDRIPGPDYPGGGRIISGPEAIRSAYETGRGSLRVQAKWTVEALARGAWRLIFTELPPGVSTSRVLSEIESLSNPTPKTSAGKGAHAKKTLSTEQQALKSALLAQIDTVRDESGKAHAVRIVVEPKSRQTDADVLVKLLLAHTSLETNAPINLTVLDRQGRAPVTPLPTIIREWVGYRLDTVRRRTEYRLQKTLARIHILEGRMRVLLDIDAVIRVIRESDDPKADLISHFSLTEIQAEDILEIRLRQLARLAGIEIERELEQKRQDAEALQILLDQEGALRALVASEIRSDTERFGDPRRTEILDEAVQPTAKRETKAQMLQIVDEPVTLLVSNKGWLRSRSGHNIDLSQANFKEGDGPLAVLSCRSTSTVLFLDTTGRSYSLAASQFPGGRGDGIPLTSQVDLQGALVTAIAGQPQDRCIVSGSGGYGFVTTLENMISRNRAGKVFLILGDGEKPLPLRPISEECDLIALSSDKRVLVFSLSELKELPKGKGVKLIQLSESANLRYFDLRGASDVPVRISQAKLDQARGHRAGRGIKITG